ncbi:MAG TPA: sigma-70 family RNA polymerase sigma factor [Burkholderiaceae bacterium]|jgi:RNA polymerase sigma-70 factor (ECF subfamily)|nr:sigma-70 family RNA polymerase sigma factor [Burkholderiaceae bacterium]
MAEGGDCGRFERLLLPHLDAAYGLARWLLRDDTLAEDAVQEAYLRAFRFFGSLKGDNARPWLLKIVRHACYELLARERLAAGREHSEESDHGSALAPGAALVLPLNPESAALADADRALVRDCLGTLPAVFREALVLRELQGCSYKEIASILGAPIGTVMSRLSRARRLLHWAIAERLRRDGTGT